MINESQHYRFYQGEKRPSTDKLFERISSIDHLPTLPSIVKNALAMLDDPDVSISRLSKVVSEDPSMASRILKVANSPYYARSGKVGSVHEAILHLGLNGSRALILSMTILNLISGRKGVVSLWKHSFAVSVLSRILAELLKLDSPENLATSGLLHDFGKVIYFLDFEEWVGPLMEKDPETPDWRYEEDLFGASHPFVGFRLAYFWRFPSSIRVPIGWHNNPMKAPSYQVETSVVALADGLAAMAGFGLEEAAFPEAAMLDAITVLDLSEEALKGIFSVLLRELSRMEAPDFNVK